MSNQSLVLVHATRLDGGVFDLFSERSTKEVRVYYPAMPRRACSSSYVVQYPSLVQELPLCVGRERFIIASKLQVCNVFDARFNTNSVGRK